MKVRIILLAVIALVMGQLGHLYAMNPNANFTLDERREKGLAQMGDAGWCPSMVRVPLKKSFERLIGCFTCIPSGRCDGSCCGYVPASKNIQVDTHNSKAIVQLQEQHLASEDEEKDLALFEDVQARKEAVIQLRDALKIVTKTTAFKKVLKSVGKADAMDIVKTAIDESSDSSDSDTDSSTSVGSPHHTLEEELFEILEKRATGKHNRTESL